jgi:hypothetical protein
MVIKRKRLRIIRFDGSICGRPLNYRGSVLHFIPVSNTVKRYVVSILPAIS